MRPRAQTAPAFTSGGWPSPSPPSLMREPLRDRANLALSSSAASMMASPMCQSPAPPPPPGTPYHQSSSNSSFLMSGCSSARRTSHDENTGRTPKEKVTPVCPRYFVAPSRPGKRHSRTASQPNMILGAFGGFASTSATAADPSAMGFPSSNAMAMDDDDMMEGDDFMEEPLRGASAPGASASAAASSQLSQRVPHLRATSAPEAMPPPPPLQPGQYTTLVQGMVARGIRILAIDWDATMLSCHTHSCWSGTARDLVPWIRSEFLHLVRAALMNRMHVAVVTFSSQTMLVREALRIALPQCAEHIAIKGNDQSWNVPQATVIDIFPTMAPVIPTLMSYCKMPHLAATAIELAQAGGSSACVAPQQMVLVDDDANNVQLAHNHGVHAFQLQPGNPLVAFWGMMSRFVAK